MGNTTFVKTRVALTLLKLLIVRSHIISNLHFAVLVKLTHDQCELQTEKKFESKEEAIKNLKILAIWHGCNAIKNVEYIASEEQSGNYYYKLWKAKGTAGIE